MKFLVSASSIWDFNHEEPRLKLIEAYPILKDFGFEMIKEMLPVKSRIRDEKGRFIQQINYKPYYQEHITVDTIEKLLELQKAVGNPLIVTEDEIEIYDVYGE